MTGGFAQDMGHLDHFYYETYRYVDLNIFSFLMVSTPTRSNGVQVKDRGRAAHNPTNRSSSSTWGGKLTANCALSTF